LIPIKDLNRSLTPPHVTRLILIANIVIFTVYCLSSLNILFNERFAVEIESKFIMVPDDIVHGQRLYTLVTSMFMHDPSGFEAGLIHLLGNMLFLYVFGDNVEDVFGHISYFFFYIFCGLASAFVYIASVLYLTYPVDLTIGVVGASGAISGVLGAYVVLYPKARILALFFYFILPIPAIIFLGFWFLLQWLYALFEVGGNVAWWAHIGGFVAGMILASVFGLRKKKAREKMLRL
jgi:membrane associated rhomboid family serine protease